MMTMKSRGGLLGFRITARHLIDNLASGLYADHGASLWEIVRNGVCACFPGSEWVPGVGRVEIYLDRNHPLAPGVTSLVVLDRGQGFTPEGMDRFIHIGPSLQDTKANPSGQYGGAAQKRIGRFAALALNQRCYEHSDVTTGFHVLTRTASEREVTLMSLIPAHIERDQALESRTLASDALELGSLRNQRGSFTAVLIPTPVFTSLAAIRDALAYRIPRKHAQMFELLIGKEKMEPPPLPSRVSVISETTGIEIFVQVAQEGEGEGIWFADASTGLRVARGTQFHLSLPFPFGARELTGDVFIPGLLKHQDTARGGLSARYLKSPEWKNHCLYLNTQAEKLKALLGEEEKLRNSPVQKAMSEVVRLLHTAFGVPDVKGDIDTSLTDKEKKERKPSDKDKDKDSSGGGSHTKKKDTHTTASRRVGKAFKIGEETYVMVSRHMDSLLFAEAKDGIMYVNAGVYKPLPTRQEAHDEHVLNAILFAAAKQQLIDLGVEKMLLQVAEWRVAIDGSSS